jgi:CopG family nickel-responsive transcriptional regulator
MTGKVVKTGVAVPEGIMSEFEELIKTLGYRSRSRAFQDAIQLFIASNKWVRLSGRVAGCVVITYDHEEHDVEERLTDIQHEFLDVISATMHIHLSRKYCMLIIALRGDVEVIKKLYNELSSVRGITNIQSAFTLIPT